jgi:hypothetical protein
MADKSTQLVLEALAKAVTEPGGLPLYGSKATPGLFTATAPAKQAAQHCKDAGYLHVVRTETKGKNILELCGVTEKGLAYLLSQVNPKPVLEDLVRTLDARQAQVEQLVAAARQTQGTFHALKGIAEKVLQQLGRPAVVPVATNGNGAETWLASALAFLAQWQADHTSEDCALPELYRHARKTAPNLTIGQFHDGLRRLHEHERIYLHPWTGPLYDIPEPPYSVLIGHEIAYYASLRSGVTG